MKSTNIFLLPVLIIILMTSVFLVSNWREVTSTKNSEVTYTGSALPTADGRQTISITAKGGYFPKEITAEANKETLLTVSTKNTYDCSLALVIPKLNYTKNLKPQDQTTVSIPPQKAGTEIDGTCSMGMYKFTIKFV